MNQHGVNLTIKKVEFAQEETRIYLSASNQTNEKFNLYIYSSKVTQDNKQFKEEYNYDYPKISSEILPGITSEGIIVFPNIEINNFSFIIEGSSCNYYLYFEPFIFNIIIN